MIYDKPMTKAQKNQRYKEKDRAWKKANYITFCFHLPKELVTQFRYKVKENGDVQRQLLVKFMEDYIKKEPSN